LKSLTKYCNLFLFSVLVVGCSNETSNSNNKKIQYLGDRIMSAAVDGIADDKKYAPQFEDFKKLFPECEFQPISSNDQYQTARCQLDNADKAREGKPEEFTVTVTHARAGVGSVEFSGSQLHHVPDSLFSSLKNVDIKELSCPDIEQDNMATYNTKFYRLSRSGKSYGVFREIYSSGSGGGNTTTTFYYGQDAAPCSWSIENDEKISKEFKLRRKAVDSVDTAFDNAQTGNNSSSNNRADTGSSTNEIVGNFQCLFTHAISEITGTAAVLKNRFTYSYRLQGSFGTMTAPNGQTNSLVLTKVNRVDGETQYWFEQRNAGPDLRIEHRIAQARSGNFSGAVLVFKGSTVGIMTIGDCKRF